MNLAGHDQHVNATDSLASNVDRQQTEEGSPDPGSWRILRWSQVTWGT